MTRMLWWSVSIGICPGCSRYSVMLTKLIHHFKTRLIITSFTWCVQVLIPLHTYFCHGQKPFFSSNCWREGRRWSRDCLELSFTKLLPTQFLNSINISGGHQPILSKQAQLKTYNFLLGWLRLWRDFVETNDISSFTAADRSIDRGDRSTLGHWAQGEEEEETTQVSFKSSIFCFDTPSFPIHNPLVPQQLLSSLNWPAPPPPTN